jgi:hypothetical protein
MPNGRFVTPGTGELKQCEDKDDSTASPAHLYHEEIAMSLTNSSTKQSRMSLSPVYYPHPRDSCPPVVLGISWRCAYLEMVLFSHDYETWWIALFYGECSCHDKDLRPLPFEEVLGRARALSGPFASLSAAEHAARLHVLEAPDGMLARFLSRKDVNAADYRALFEAMSEGDETAVAALLDKLREDRLVEAFTAGCDCDLIDLGFCTEEQLAGLGGGGDQEGLPPAAG